MNPESEHLQPLPIASPLVALVGRARLRGSKLGHGPSEQRERHEIRELRSLRKNVSERGCQCQQGLLHRGAAEQRISAG